MSEMPIALRLMISLVEEMDARLSDGVSRREILEADLLVLSGQIASSSMRRAALLEEVVERAAALGLLVDVTGDTVRDLSDLTMRLREAFADEGRVSAPDVISLESWRRAREKASSTTVSSETLTAVADDVADNVEVPAETLEVYLDRVLTSFPTLQEKVLRTMYGYGNGYESGQLVGHHWLMQRSVGVKLNLSQQEVSLLHQKGLRMLKHPSRSKYLRSFYANIPLVNPSRAQVIIHQISGEYPLV